MNIVAFVDVDRYNPESTDNFVGLLDRVGFSHVVWRGDGVDLLLENAPVSKLLQDTEVTQSIELNCDGFIGMTESLHSYNLPMYYRVYSYRDFRDQFGVETLNVIDSIRYHNVKMVYCLDITRDKEQVLNDLEKFMLITDNLVIQPCMKNEELYVYIAYLSELDHHLKRYGYSVEYSLEVSKIVRLKENEASLGDSASQYDDSDKEVNKTLIRGLELWNTTR